MMLAGPDILRAFARLSDRLQDRGESGEIILVGGAALVLFHGTRASTHDVDAIALRPKSLLLELAAEVGEEFGWSRDWLNDRARAFAPLVTDGPSVFASPWLEVRTASVVQLLAMKLSAMRDSIDYTDARVLLAAIEGDREDVWSRVVPHLDPSMPEWKRQNFEALWRELHEPH